MTTAPQLACAVPTPRLPQSPITPELQSLIDKGVDPRWVRQLGHAPEAFIAWTKFYWPLVLGGNLELPVKEAARLRIAALNGCHY